jgi:hypothetical protein
MGGFVVMQSAVVHPKSSFRPILQQRRGRMAVAPPANSVNGE